MPAGLEYPCMEYFWHQARETCHHKPVKKHNNITANYGSGNYSVSHLLNSEIMLVIQLPVNMPLGFRLSEPPPPPIISSYIIYCFL